MFNGGCPPSLNPGEARGPSGRQPPKRVRSRRVDLIEREIVIEWASDDHGDVLVPERDHNLPRRAVGVVPFPSEWRRSRPIPVSGWRRRRRNEAAP